MSDSEDDGSARTRDTTGEQTTVLGYVDGFVQEAAAAGMDWRVSKVGGSPVSLQPSPLRPTAASVTSGRCGPAEASNETAKLTIFLPDSPFLKSPRLRRPLRLSADRAPSRCRF